MLSGWFRFDSGRPAQRVGVGRSEETTYVSIPGRTEVTDPITVTITGTSTSYQKVRVTVGRDSSATVVIDHIGSGFHGENVRLRLDPGHV